MVDSMALYDALRDNKIAFAALDVTEPVPQHRSGQGLAVDGTMVAANLLRIDSNNPLITSNLASGNLHG